MHPEGRRQSDTMARQIFGSLLLIAATVIIMVGTEACRTRTRATRSTCITERQACHRAAPLSLPWATSWQRGCVSSGD